MLSLHLIGKLFILWNVPCHKDIDCQKRIAAILSKIDRKIELNCADKPEFTRTLDHSSEVGEVRLAA